MSAADCGEKAERLSAQTSLSQAGQLNRSWTGAAGRDELNNFPSLMSWPFSNMDTSTQASKAVGIPLGAEGLTAVGTMLAHSPLQGCCCNGSLQHHWHRRQCQCVPHSQHEEGETGISPEILSVWTKGGRAIPTLDVLQYTCMGWKLPQGCVPEPWGAAGQGPAVRTHPSTPAWSRAAEAAPGQPHTRHWALP